MIRFSQWQFNPENGALESDTERHRLPPRLVKLLILLTQNAPHLVEKQTLISEIWQDKIVNDDALARSIAELRRLLGDSSQAPTFIETVPRRGYCFIAEVREVKSPNKKGITPFIVAGALLLCLFTFALFSYFDLGNSPEATSDLQTKIHNARRFNADAQMEYQPEISPGGKLVAYGVRDDEDIVVKISDASGKDLYQIAEPGTWVLSPAWSPDERKIAVAIADTEQCNIYVVDLPELTRQRLSHCTMPNGSGILDWSPDGKNIAFVAREEENGSQPSIFIYELESGVFSRTTVPPSDEVFDSRPRFDKDGKSLYFLRGTRSTRDIYRTAISGNDSVERLTSSKNFKMGFALNHQSHEIVFDSNTNGDRNLWLLSLADLSVTNLGARDSQFPSISKQGQLLYQEVRYQANLWHFDLVSNQSRLLVDSPKYDNNPAISPDGKLLAYVSNRFGRAEIWLYDLASENDSRLFALNTADLLAPVWSAEGLRLLMSSRSDEGYGCYEMHLKTREIRQIDGQGMDIYNCHYRGKDSILAVNKTENAVSQLLQITNEQVNILIDDGINKALPLANGDIVYTLVTEPGLHLLQTGSSEDSETLNTKTLIPEFPNHRMGYWTAAGEVLYFINPQNPSELLSLNISTNEQSTLLEGIDLAVGYAISVSSDKNFAVISQKGQSQSNLFITADE